MTLQCAMCKVCFETWEYGAIYITEVYPQHIGDPPEIYHFCGYKCLGAWAN